MTVGSSGAGLRGALGTQGGIRAKCKQRIRRCGENHKLARLMGGDVPRSDFSSSCGSEKLYGNALIDPPNGLGRCGEFVSVITSCWSASSRWASTCLRGQPLLSPRSARRLPIRPTERHLPATHSACHRNAGSVQLFLCEPPAFAQTMIGTVKCPAPKARLRGTGRYGILDRDCRVSPA